jgi:RimJ/RimL family protein N-acetyltransferase
LAFRFIYGGVSNPEMNTNLMNYVGYRLHGRPHDFGPCGTLGVCQGERLLGVVVFHEWLPQFGIIEISAAADDPRWLCKRTIREVMGICFSGHRCQQIVSRMAADNHRAIKIFDYLEFQKIRLPNLKGKGKDEFVMLFTDDQWAEHRLNKV